MHPGRFLASGGRPAEESLIPDFDQVIACFRRRFDVSRYQRLRAARAVHEMDPCVQLAPRADASQCAQIEHLYNPLLSSKSAQGAAVGGVWPVERIDTGGVVHVYGRYIAS